jgi:hypothetical protein
MWRLECEEKGGDKQGGYWADSAKMVYYGRPFKFSIARVAFSALYILTTFKTCHSSLLLSDVPNEEWPVDKLTWKLLAQPLMI